jgi:hypothetical protein
VQFAPAPNYVTESMPADQADSPSAPATPAPVRSYVTEGIEQPESQHSAPVPLVPAPSYVTEQMPAAQ